MLPMHTILHPVLCSAIFLQCDDYLKWSLLMFLKKNPLKFPFFLFWKLVPAMRPSLCTEIHENFSSKEKAQFPQFFLSRSFLGTDMVDWNY
jgi:hypothetical protein